MITPLLSDYQSEDEEQKKIPVDVDKDEDSIKISILKQESEASISNSPRREYFMEYLKKSSNKTRTKPSFYFKGGGSEKANSSDSDHDQLNLFAHQSSYTTPKKVTFGGNSPKSRFLKPIEIPKEDYWHPSFDMEQATPMKNKKAFQTFNTPVYHSFLNEENKKNADGHLEENKEDSKSEFEENDIIKPIPTQPSPKKKSAAANRGLYKVSRRQTLADVPEFED